MLQSHAILPVMRLGDLDYLVAVADSGSLSGGARRLGVSVSTVGRRLEVLERALALRLLDRRASGVQLTPDGERIAALANSVVDAAAQVERAAAAMRTNAKRQPLRVSATELVISDVLAPALPDLVRDGGDLVIHLQSQPEVVSLAARDADLAIRMSRPEGNSLVARALPDLRLAMFASEACLGGRDPAAIDLAQERLLIYDDSYGRLPELDWLDRAGLVDAVRMRSGSTRALIMAVAAGAGIGLLPVALARREPGLIELPSPFPIPPRTPWLTVHRDLQRQPAIRTVHRWIVRTFAALKR